MAGWTGASDTESKGNSYRLLARGSKQTAWERTAGAPYLYMEKQARGIVAGSARAAGCAAAHCEGAFRQLIHQAYQASSHMRLSAVRIKAALIVTSCAFQS